MGIDVDTVWMEKAYALAMDAEARGEVPIGAILVSENNEYLSGESNQVISLTDPSAHAEMLVLREAALKIGNYRLLNTTLYTTLEPCVMCAGAMVHARIKRLVFACRDPRAGAAGSVCNVLGGFPWNHQVEIDEGLKAHECSLLLKNFFIKRRSLISKNS